MRVQNAVNRRWNDETGDHEWQDQTWKPWTSLSEEDSGLTTYIDDDVMGFMLAEAAKTDGNDELDTLKKGKKKVTDEIKGLTKDNQKEEDGKSLKEKRKSLKEKLKELTAKIKVMSQGKTDKRKGALEVTRAISLLPFVGDITFNAKSGEKSNTSLYGTEVHATRYQYGIALTPESLRERSRVLDVIDAVVNLSEVAGNQSRFLYDFAPESVVLRWTDDFAPRFLYGFEMDSKGEISFEAVLDRVQSGDISADELYIGGKIVKTISESQKEILGGAFLSDGVKNAANALKDKIKVDLGV